LGVGRKATTPLVKKNTNKKIQREGQVPHRDLEPMEEKGEEEKENFEFVIFVFFFFFLK